MLILRKVESTDIQYFAKWWQDAELIALTSGDYSKLDDATIARYFSNLTNNKSQMHYMITIDGITIGHISLIKQKDTWYELQTIIGDAAYRGKGYGPLAINEIMKIARAKSIQNICLFVRPENAHAIKAYKKVGFKKVGAAIQTDNKNQPVLDRMVLVITESCLLKY